MLLLLVFVAFVFANVVLLVGSVINVGVVFAPPVIVCVDAVLMLLLLLSLKTSISCCSFRRCW